MKRTGRISPADIGLLVLVNLLWGSTYVVARDVLDTTPPIVLAFVRYAIASLWMLICGYHRVPRRTAAAEAHAGEKAGRGAAWALAGVGLVGFGLAKVLGYEGLARSTATDGALIINLEAVFTAVFGVLLLRQHLGRAQWLGVLVALGGALLLVTPEPGETASGSRFFGNVLMVASVAAEAIGSVLGVRAMRRYTGLQITALATYCGTLCLFPFAFWQWRATAFSLVWLNGWNIVSLLYLALAATILAYAVWYQVLGRVDAGRAATFLYAQPLVGVCLAIVLRGEWPTVNGVAGGALVLVGIAVSSMGTSAKTVPVA